MAHNPLWRLELLGVPHLIDSSGSIYALRRKTAAVLTYLSLNGPASRSRVAGLLWPATTEATARNSLVQVIRKLRLMLGADLIEGSGVLNVGDAVRVDVTEARAALAGGNAIVAARSEGQLLGTDPFEDCPDFASWLSLERDRWAADRRAALRTLLAHAETERNAREYLEWAARLEQAEPNAEDASLHLMKAHYLLGNLDDALAVYRACEAMLEREFGTTPSGELRALANTLERACRARSSASSKARGTSPVRARALIGREREWAAMEDAWAKGQFIFLTGEPGVGKTRLAREFAASKGAYDVFSGRPGDAFVPFSANARRLRDILATNPDMTLEPWVRAELSRILPELTDEPPPPLESDDDRERFFDAQGEVIRLGSRGIQATVIDDLQFFDRASIDVGDYLVTKFGPLGRPGGLPRFIDCYRRGELPRDIENVVQYTVSVGFARVIEVEPLPERTAIHMIAQLGVDVPMAVAREVARRTGGNPQFILETIKHVTEAAPDAPLALPDTVTNAIERRLHGLPPAVVLTLRAAAVLQRDFNPDLIAEVLDTSVLDVLEHWDTLERAQLLQGDRFAHDLVGEAVRTTMPDSVARTLHLSAARVLAAREAEHARTAHHWDVGGDYAAAGAAYRRAALQASANLRPREAAQLHLDAAHAFETASQFELAREQRDAAAHVAERHDLDLADLTLHASHARHARRPEAGT